MTSPIAYIVLDESSPRLIAGQYQFDRVCSGALIIPSGSNFPGDPFAGELFWRTSNSSLYRRNTANTAWEQASGGGGDISASYIVVGNTGSLGAERALSSSLGVLFDDNGANSNFVIRINELEVPILSASNTFTGPNLFSGGLSGSLTHLADGTSYISGAGSIAVITQSNGSLLISGTDTSPGGIDRQLQFNDSDSFGGNTNLWIDSSNNLLASGSITSAFGFSGSLTKLSDGTSAFIAGPNITISSASNGAITIQSSIGAGDIADIDASYVVVGNTGSLPNERALSSSLGILFTDNGANSSFEIQVNEIEIPILSASNDFTGDISLSGGDLVLKVTGSTQITGSVYISGSSVDGNEFLFELDGSGSAEFHGNRIRHAGVAETSASEPDPFAEGMIWLDPSADPGGIGGTIAIDAITGSYTFIDENTVIIADATSGHVTASLPTAIGRNGKTFYIKKIDSSANNVVIEPSGSQTIDGDTEKTLSVQYTSLMIVSDNSEWWII